MAARGWPTVIVPDHRSKPIPVGTLKSIIAGSKLSADDFANIISTHQSANSK